MRWTTLKKDEQGISTVIVAVSLVGIFGATMLSLDAGNMWQTRRKIVTGTDSTALQQAKTFAFEPAGTNGSTVPCPEGITDAWTDHLVSTGGSGTTPISCNATWGVNGTGYITVEGRKLSDTRFGSLLGIGDTHPYSMSAAQWGFVTEGTGLRPMAFCVNNDHVQEWLQMTDGGEITPDEQTAYNNLRSSGDTNGDGKIDHPVPADASYGVVHRMFFTLNDPSQACGTFPGNWGFLSFNGNGSQGGTGQTETNDWIQNGYNDGTVEIRDSSDPACPGVPGQGDADDAAEGCVPADPGTLSNANRTYLDSILHKKIHVLVFDTGACGSAGSGGGATCTLEAWGFLGVILRGYDATGACTPTNCTRYFDFEFTELILSGTCCVGAPPNGEDTGVRGVKLCDVDHDASGMTVAERCAL